MRVYPFPQRIERAGIVLPDPEVLAELGNIAVSNHETPVFQAEGESLGLTALHDYVFLLASVGGTTQQVADVLRQPEEVIASARDEINDLQEKRTMAASVFSGIHDKFIPIEAHKAFGTTPNSVERKILRGVALGLTNGEIGRRVSKSKLHLKPIMDELWRKIGADGRTHGIRRTAELDISVFSPGQTLSPV